MVSGTQEAVLGAQMWVKETEEFQSPSEQLKEIQINVNSCVLLKQIWISMGNYKCINDLFPELYEMKTWCMPLMSKDMESVLVFSKCSQVQETQMLLHWPGDASPRRRMEHTEEAPDGAPSPRRQLLSFPLLSCSPGSLIWLRVPKCTQILCLRSQSFSQILQTLKHRKRDGAGPQREKCLCSAWGTACWGLAGRGTPKDSEKCRDGKGLTAGRSDFGLSVTGEGDGLLEKKGG